MRWPRDIDSFRVFMLTVPPAHRCHEFLDLWSLTSLTAGGDRLLHAVWDTTEFSMEFSLEALSSKKFEAIQRLC